MADIKSTNTTTSLSRSQLFKKKLKKYLYLTVVFLIIVLGVYIYWAFFFTFSDGTRTGTLLKFSRKGTVFKTWEGELILPNIQSNTNATFSSEKFIFSVVNKDIAAQLEKLQGDYIDLHYNQKNKALPWHGETVFIVTSAEVHK
jgi:hypothetical protein